MAKTGGGGRPLRADAARNRERLLEVAKTAFAAHGPDVSLEAIARRAGVGIGTLYRHFPTREAIVEAVYRREVEQLAASADRLLAELPPGEALRQWMRLFIDYFATKKAVAPALAAMVGGTAIFRSSGDAIRAAIGKLLDRAIASGDVRADIDPADVMQALSGLAYNIAGSDWRDRALRLVDIVVAGLRPPR
jgi:AcrR family transcriptional regulator